MGEFHCLSVGCCDASVIITDTATFLVDCYNIDWHTDILPANKNIRGIFITHQHEDHFSGLNYLKDNDYTVEWLIYSPYDRRRGDNSVTLDEWNEFESLKDYFVSNGTETRTPYRQESWVEPFWDTNSIKFWIVGPDWDNANSDTREMHDASLIIKADLGGRHVCFAGDGSDSILQYIADNTNNYCNDILHASHHGSINGANLDFIKSANIKYTMVSTESGVYENVPHPTALRRYRDNTENDVRRTDVDGSWKWEF